MWHIKIPNPTKNRRKQSIIFYEYFFVPNAADLLKIVGQSGKPHLPW